jgi:hypothetical protein
MIPKSSHQQPSRDWYHEHPSHVPVNKAPIDPLHHSHIKQSEPLPSDFEIIRQGYGITQPMRSDIVDFFKQSHS